MEARLRELKLKTKMRGSAVQGSAQQLVEDAAGGKVDPAIRLAENEFKDTIEYELRPPAKSKIYSKRK